MSTIGVKCIDQTLAFTDMPVITTGDKNIDKIKFDFCDKWDGFIKVAVFFQQKGEFSYSLINEDGSCNIPNSILKLTGRIFIAVSGTNKNNQVRTTEIICYKIGEGVADVDINDEFPGQITEEEKEDVYNKMFELVNEMQTLCQDLIKNFAYVRIKDGNEFSYDLSALYAQINAYTYSKQKIDEMILNINNSLGNGYYTKTEVDQSIGNAVRNEAQDREKDIANVNQSIDDLTVILNKKIDGLNGTCDTLNANIKALQGGLNTLSSTHSVDIKDLKDRIAVLENKHGIISK